MAQLQQRLSMTCWLQPLSEADIGRYIDHRLRVGGYKGGPLFSEDAVRTVSLHSGGVPRKVNRICFNSLSLGYALEEKIISQATVEKAISDTGIPWAARQRSLRRPPDVPSGNSGPPASQGSNGASIPERRKQDAPGKPAGKAAPIGTAVRAAVAEPVAARSVASQSAAHPSLQLAEKMLGPEHPDIGDLLANLAELHHKQGKYADAEALHQRALRVREKALGSNHPKVATSLNGLALLYRDQGKNEEAQKLMERSLAIVEKTLSPERTKTGLWPNTRLTLLNLQVERNGFEHGRQRTSERSTRTHEVENRSGDPEKDRTQTRRQTATESRPQRRPWYSLMALSALFLGPGARPCF
jgi:tetratricopeptide (TPR) repeat protein